jgi:hypothetical protein
LIVAKYFYRYQAKFHAVKPIYMWIMLVYCIYTFHTSYLQITPCTTILHHCIKLSTMVLGHRTAKPNIRVIRMATSILECDTWLAYVLFHGYVFVLKVDNCQHPSYIYIYQDDHWATVETIISFPLIYSSQGVVNVMS